MRVLLGLLFVWPVFAQSAVCPGAVTWSPCELSFDLRPGDADADATLRAEFRSPRHRTYLMHGFRDGARFVVRFSPTEAGEWDFRVTSSLKRLEEERGTFHVAESSSPGFVRPANVHHFATEDEKPHLWMATSVDHFLDLPRPEFDQLVAQRAKEKFTHLRVTVESGADLNEAAARIRKIHDAGMTTDLVLGSLPEDRRERERYVIQMAARFSAYNLTWMGLPGFENTPGGRRLLEDAGRILKDADPYDHPRTSLAEGTSAALARDEWQTLRSYGTVDPNVGAVEHQFYQSPAINTAIRSQQDLWNATMNGQYPASGSGPYMTAWFDFMSGNRYWELEPHFDVQGGRALALDDVEYIVYVEKPGPVDLVVADHGYDVAWIDPATGRRIKSKGQKGTHVTADPPDTSHDWILHVSREGRKDSMLKSYRFASRRVPIQEIETNAAKTPFAVTTPDTESAVSLSAPPFFSLRITRKSRATESLLIEWSGEVTVDGEGYRILGTGMEGTWNIPKSIAHKLPAALTVRVAILNAFGKAYQIDKVYRLVP